MAMNDEIIIYKSEDGIIKVDVLFSDETVWLTQEQMAILFQRDKSVISRHIRNIFDEGELQEEVVVAKNAITTPHGAMANKQQTREIRYYNLDVIISVGSREIQRGHTISYLGNPTTSRLHNQRLRAQ